MEQAKLGDQKLALIQAYARDFLTMNDEKADQLARRALQLDDQRQALRKQYYELFKKALPTVLVVRFFPLDNQIQLVVDLQIAANLPIIEEAAPKSSGDSARQSSPRKKTVEFAVNADQWIAPGSAGFAEQRE